MARQCRTWLDDCSPNDGNKRASMPPRPRHTLSALCQGKGGETLAAVTHAADARSPGARQLVPASTGQAQDHDAPLAHISIASAGLNLQSWWCIMMMPRWWQQRVLMTKRGNPRVAITVTTPPS